MGTFHEPETEGTAEVDFFSPALSRREKGHSVGIQRCGAV